MCQAPGVLGPTGPKQGPPYLASPEQAGAQEPLQSWKRRPPHSPWSFLAFVVVQELGCQLDTFTGACGQLCLEAWPCRASVQLELSGEKHPLSQQPQGWPRDPQQEVGLPAAASSSDQGTLASTGPSRTLCSSRGRRKRPRLLEQSRSRSPTVMDGLGALGESRGQGGGGVGG